MARICISTAEAERDLRAWIARARTGEDIVIEDAGSPAVILRVAPAPRLRRLSESLRLARAHAVSATLDRGFAADLEAAVRSQAGLLESPWD